MSTNWLRQTQRHFITLPSFIWTTSLKLFTAAICNLATGPFTHPDEDWLWFSRRGPKICIESRPFCGAGDELWPFSWPVINPFQFQIKIRGAYLEYVEIGHKTIPERIEFLPDSGFVIQVKEFISYHCIFSSLHFQFSFNSLSKKSEFLKIHSLNSILISVSWYWRPKSAIIFQKSATYNI